MAGAPVDVKELSNCYIFEAEVPGMSMPNIKVFVENDNILKIIGERKREESKEVDIKYVRVERQAGKFQRKFNLPTNANVDKISAKCVDGLLTITVPKYPPPEYRCPRNFEVMVETESCHSRPY